MITRIQDDLKQAMRDKNSTKLNVLRALKTALSNASLQKGNVNEQLTEIEIIGLIRKQIAQRQDSVEQFVNAQRHDLVLNETNEIEILNDYLPAALTAGEIDDIIKQAINDTMAITKKDMGKAIKRALELSSGRVDNKTISKRVGELL